MRLRSLYAALLVAGVACGSSDARKEHLAAADSGVADGAAGDAGGCLGEGCSAECDGAAPTTWYEDADGDGLGDPAATLVSCSQPEGYVSNDDDPYPTCEREQPAQCTGGDFRCGEVDGARELCIEADGCADWQPAASCGESAPKCVEGACEACTVDADCQRFGKVCDAGQCVQCTPEREEELCLGVPPVAGKACDPVAKTCTGEPRQSVGACGRPITPGDSRTIRCVSDSECAAGSRCVATTFEGANYGNYCLLAAGNGVVCSAPWPRTVQATSVGGVDGQFCFPRELLATCEAVIEFGAVCDDDADCGRDGVDDGHCVGPDGGKRCTYACSGYGDCDGATCSSFGSDRFCNPF